MGGALATIISAISDDVVAALAAAGYPPLVDGKIVVGTAAEFEQLAPPRIIFDPSPGSKFSTAEYASASAVLDTLERKHQNAMRTIAAEDVMFTVHCWGSAGQGASPIEDYDVTRALYHQVRASLQKIMPGSYMIEESGKYRVGANAIRLGRWYTFGVTFFTPVLSSLLPYDRVRQYAPDNVTLGGGSDFVAPPNPETGGGPARPSDPTIQTSGIVLDNATSEAVTP